MYPDWFVFVGLTAAAIFIWLGILSYFIISGRKFLKSLFPKSGERDIRKKFEEVLKSVSDLGERENLLAEKLKKLEEKGLGHIQRLELLRYNPYEDTGGDQSFSVALLSHQGDGVVITSLHTRSETRVFAKGIEKAKAVKYQLSEEEERVVKKAMAK